MKKPLLIVLIILAVILALPVFKFLSWTFKAKKPMDIIILNKTVPTVDREKHRSLSWILTNERIVKKGKGSYSFRKDYYGFVPTRPLREKLWKQNNLRLPDVMQVADQSDVLYYADTYGVFFNDWYKGINKSRRSRRLYGGLNNTDYLYLYEMQNRKKLCILEYNTLDYPTAELERYKTKERLGIEVSGWTGKFFHSLDTAAKGNEDFPVWMTAMYRKAYQKPWAFKKAGIVFLKERDILVLEEGTHLNTAVPFIIADSSIVQKYGVSEKISFTGWFDIITPSNSNVLANYTIETNSTGDTLLADKGLTNHFPAIVNSKYNDRTYYFAGDFATNNVPFVLARVNNSGTLLKSLLYSDKPDDSRRFFWLFYKPLVTGILTDYYNQTKGQ